MGASVFGQRVDEIDVDAEEIVDGVLIFAAIEAAKDGAFLGIVLGGEVGAESGGEGLEFRGGRLGLFGWWHFVGGDPVEDADPFFEGGGGAWGGGEG